MTDKRSHDRADQNGGLNRRDFVRAAGLGAVSAGALGSIPLGAFAAGPSMKSAAETAAAKLFASMSDEQSKTVCLPWNDPRRTRVNANWDITKPGVGSSFYTKEQQGLIREVFKGVCSQEGHERFLKQCDVDGGGFDFYTMAMFGKPGTEQFEFVLTGRHLTIRADGDSNAGMAFGGPIVYGHGDGNPARNMYHYQAKQANEVFGALDEKQRGQALLQRPPRETAVQLQGEKGAFQGLAGSDLTDDQKELLTKTLKTVLAPYREEDVKESLEIVESGGGIDALRIAFYRKGDLGNDGLWDVWRVEGPTFVSHFRGAPHVHAYIHVGNKPA